MDKKEYLYRRGRLMYILEAGLEYLVSILVAGSFLATLTKEIGMSDSLTGILSSVISLGCLFQLFSVPIRINRVKPLVIALSIANQLLFSFLYIIPLTRLHSHSKAVLFVVSIFLAYLLYYIAHPKKINWLMSLVDEHHRGDFTANKEIVSLLAGMIFSFSMGGIVDYFVEQGKIRTAFIISAVVMLILSVLHTVSMLLAVEKPINIPVKKSIKANIKDVISNKNILKVALAFILYYIAAYCATPFYGTYQINELSFSLKTVTFLGILSSISRILVSKFWGKYADKHSFAVMFEKCLIILAMSALCVVFALPRNGIIMFTLYYIFHGIALGGINSALINMIFDYVEPQRRADSLSICQAAAGLSGFFSTLLASAPVSYIQKNPLTLFGFTIYAQQLVSLISVLFIIICIVYVRLIVREK